MNVTHTNPKAEKVTRNGTVVRWRYSCQLVFTDLTYEDRVRLCIPSTERVGREVVHIDRPDETVYYSSHLRPMPVKDVRAVIIKILDKRIAQYENAMVGEITERQDI